MVEALRNQEEEKEESKEISSHSIRINESCNENISSNNSRFQLSQGQDFIPVDAVPQNNVPVFDIANNKEEKLMKSPCFFEHSNLQ